MSKRLKHEGEWIINITEGFIRNPKISPQAKVIYLVLKSFCTKELTAFPSIAEIKRLTGLGNSAIIKYRRELEEKGFISTKAQRDSKGYVVKNIYTLSTNKEFSQIPLLGISENQENLLIPFYRNGKSESSIISLLSNTIDLSINLLSNYDENDKSKLAPIVKKFERELGKEKLQKVLTFLIIENKKFDSLNSLAAYLQSCTKRKTDSKITDELRAISENENPWE